MQHLKTMVKFLWLKLDDDISGGQCGGQGQGDPELALQDNKKPQGLESENQNCRTILLYLCVWAL